MPAVPLHRAIATKSSIGALFAMAEAEGFVEIWLPTEHACKNVRNKCYAHRAKIRKQGLALTSVESSPYDGYSFTWVYDDPTGRYKFRIDSDEQIEFELIIPDGCIEEDLHKFGFDWATESDVPQMNLDRAEDNLYEAANEYIDGLEIHRSQRVPHPDDDIPF